MDREKSILKLAAISSIAIGKSHATIGIYAVENSRLIPALVAGGFVRPSTYARVTHWFSDHWPTGLDWPVDIPRPEPAADSPYALALAAAQSEPLSPVPTASPAAVMRAVEAANDAIDAAWADENFSALPELERAAVTAGSALAPSGQIASPEAFCLSLKIPRHAYDEVVRQYADGRPRDEDVPRFGCQMYIIFAELLRSGDCRFSSRAHLLADLLAQERAMKAITEGAKNHALSQPR